MEKLSKDLEQLEMGGGSRASDPSFSTPRYNYQSLGEPDHMNIRILKLYATKERIECNLQQIKVWEGGYQALSYVWGKQEKPFSAFVFGEDGEELGYIPLTENLKNALCNLRDAEEVKTKVFWIDQICINQEGEEKSGQVSMMGDIYRHAERVITYIGPAAIDEEEEKRGVETLNRIHEHFAPNHDLIFQAQSMGKAEFDSRSLPVVNLPRDIQEDAVYHETKYERCGWRWLCHVAYGDWTRRLWIVQEQFLNREAVMLRGTALLSWDAVATLPLMFGLGLLPQRYADLFQRRNLSESDLSLIDIDESVYHIWHSRKLQRQTGSSKPVYNLLANMAMHRPLQCWDQRDRIYALLAISKDADVLGLVPDYSAPSHTVYLQATVLILLLTQNLAPLYLAVQWAHTSDSKTRHSIAALGSTPTLPSWALRPPTCRVPASFHYGQYKPHPRRSITVRPSNFRLNQSILVLKGRVLDRIAMSTPAVLPLHLSNFEVDISTLAAYSRVMLHWRAVLRYLGMTSRNVASLCRALAVIHAWAPKPRKGRSVDESATFEFVSTCRRWLWNNKSARRLPIPPEIEALHKQCTSFVQELVATFSDDDSSEVFDTDTPLSSEEFDATILADSIIWQGRSFCVTDSGRVCNAMHEPEKGDLVAAFQGSGTLFVLRKVGERYRLVGEAYVDGLMNGEAYEGIDPDEVDYDIELV